MWQHSLLTIIDLYIILTGKKKKKNSAPQSYCKRCWNQILCFVFPAPHTFQSRILSIPLPVCPLSRNKIQRMPGVFCTFLIWLLVQGHVSAKHVSICLSLAAFKMSAVFWETEASEAMWKQYILSINNISCFIWLVMGHAFFFSWFLKQLPSFITIQGPIWVVSGQKTRHESVGKIIWLV